MLEHVEDPYGLSEAFASNASARYLFLAVPLFSPSVIMEGVFPGVMPRVLGLGHTHLFTEQSYQWLTKKHGFESIGNWWFGSDAFDMHRYIDTTLRMSSDSSHLSPEWDRMILPILDELQLTMDRHKSTSEVHSVFRLTKGKTKTVINRDKQWVEREFGTDKWPAIQKQISDQLEAGETSLARIISHLNSYEWGTSSVPTSMISATLSGQPLKLPSSFGWNGMYAMITDILVDASQDADAIYDLGAGWGFGARLFKVREHIGIVEVKDRLLDLQDNGDFFQPVR